MSTKKQSQARSITFSVATDRNIDKIMKLPQYRNNRSMAIESLITTNPIYIELTQKKKKSSDGK